MVVAGWGDEFSVSDGSSFGRMVEGPADLARVMGLEDELSCLQTDLSIWPIAPSSLGSICLGHSPWH